MPEPKFSILAVVLSVGVLQGFLLSSVLFFTRRGDLPSNRYLGGLVASFSILSVGDILVRSRLLETWPHLYLVFDPLVFLPAPFFYLYVRRLSRHEGRGGVLTLAHFLPAIAAYLAAMPVYLLDEREKRVVVLEVLKGPPDFLDPVLAAAALQLLIYYLLSARLVLGDAICIPSAGVSPGLAEKFKPWLRRLLALGAALILLFILSVVLRIRLFADIGDFLFTVTVYLIGYMGLLRPEVLFTAQPRGKLVPGLPDSEAERRVSELDRLIRKERLYLRPSLSLPDVAARMGMAPHLLSRLLNERVGRKFNDYVNSLRVEELKRLLRDPAFAHLKILALGMQAGFNSKATMNEVFKKATGMSPARFRGSDQGVKEV